MAVEKRITKIVDRDVQDRGASVENVGDQGAIITKVVSMPTITVDPPVGGATSAIQTDGTQKTQIVDAGGEAATVTGGKLDVNASVDTTGLALENGGNLDTLAGVDFAKDSTLTDGTQTVQLVDASNTPVNITLNKLEVDTGLDISSLATETTLQGVEAEIQTGNGDLATIVTNTTGISTSAKQDTIIGHLDGVEGLLTTIEANQLPDGHNVTVDNASIAVTAAALPLPSGASTSANQTTIIGYLDGVEGLLTTIDADTGAIKTAVEVIDNAIAGSEMQVDVVTLPAIPAGSNNIGDVDVASLPATPAGTNAIGKLLPPDYDVTTHTAKAQKYYTNAGAVTDGIVWSPAAGKRWHIVSMYIQTSADATVTLEDDLGAGDSPVLKGEFSAKSGVAYNFSEMYPLASGEDAADLLVTTTAGNIYITITGYEI